MWETDSKDYREVAAANAFDEERFPEVKAKMDKLRAEAAMVRG